jgi:hypothetical protein
MTLCDQSAAVYTHHRLNRWLFKFHDKSNARNSNGKTEKQKNLKFPEKRKRQTR